MRRTAGVCGSLLVMALASGASAGITAVWDWMEQVAAPADCRPDVFTNPTMIRVWEEQQNVLLRTDLVVNAIDPGLYNDWDQLGAYNILAGTYVNSYYVHFDSPGVTTAEARGSFRVGEDILGVIVLGDAAEDPMQSLDPSDFLGALGTIYPDSQYRRGLEMFNDRFIISADRREFTLKSYIITPGDAVRVITQGVPAPASLSAIAVGLLARRRRRA